MRTKAAQVWLRLSASPWLIPLTLVWVISDTSNWMVEQVGAQRAAGTFIVLGAVAGWLWYVGSPRPLAERLYPFVLLAALATVLIVVSNDLGDVDVPGACSLVGIVGGLVIAERFPVSWRRQRDMALSTRRSMAEHR